MENNYIWTDNPTVSGISEYDPDILNDCLMHLKYDVVTDFNEIISDYAKKDFSNSTKPYVTEVSSADLLPSWYRVWSDGWIEQGNRACPTGSSVTFLKPFKDNDYTLVGPGFYVESIGSMEISCTATGFSTSALVRTSGIYSGWYACGY